MTNRLEHHHTARLSNKHWTIHEDTELITGFERGATLSELARKHARDRGHVSSRLILLGKIKPTPWLFVRA